MYLNILICQERDGIITHVAKPVNILLEEHKQFTSIEPTIRIGRGMDAKSLLKSIEEELPRIGHTPRPQSYLEGELRATKEHLKDLRSVFGIGDESCQRTITVKKLQ
jgi:hypothetical protein